MSLQSDAAPSGMAHAVPQPSDKYKCTMPKSSAANDINSEVKQLLTTLTDQQKQLTQLQMHLTGMLTRDPTSAHAAWGAWIGSMAESIHKELLPRFYKQSFDLVMGLVAESNQLRDQQPATTAATTAATEGCTPSLAVATTAATEGCTPSLAIATTAATEGCTPALAIATTAATTEKPKAMPSDIPK